MNLHKALRAARNDRIAFVGAGGKTTGLFQLARAFETPVVVTTSTHMGSWQAELADVHLIVSRPDDLERCMGQVEGVTLITGEIKEDRLQGLDLDILSSISHVADRLGFPVLMEADGSRLRPIKAPAEHEPVIPEWIKTVVVVAGLSGLNQPLSDSVVHRSEQFAKFTGMRVGEQITPEHLARLLIHPQGGQKHLPAGVRKVALLNQADNADLTRAGLRVANIIRESFDSVLVASLSERIVRQALEPTAGIILAAGRSSRFGQPKMLLEWKGKPLIHHIAEAGLAAGLDPIIVVTGAVDQPVRHALMGLPVQVVFNPDWEKGQSTSVRSGISALDPNVGSAVFLLADQPLVTPDLLFELVGSHSCSLAPVVAPKISGRRANPVLFDRDTFPKLLELEGDTGGRAVFDQFLVEYVDWGDDRLLLDIDTPEDYARLQGIE